MEFFGRLLGIGGAILTAVIVLAVILGLQASGQLDNAVLLLLGIFNFLILDLGGLLVRVVDKLLTQF